MTQPLSIDLRERVISAVEEGMSRRGAAERFGIAVSTAIKLVDQWRRTGDVRPRPQGGDNRSQRIEAHAEEILALIEQAPDITLGEIAVHLDEKPPSHRYQRGSVSHAGVFRDPSRPPSWRRSADLFKFVARSVQSSAGHQK